MLNRFSTFWKGGGAAAPDVEFLSATQVAESDGSSSFTSMSGSYTPHADADFVMGIMLIRNGGSNMAGSAMSLNAVSMGAAISSDDGLGTNRPHIMAFGTSTFSAGTLAYTRTGGTGGSGQLWGASFRFVDAVGTPVKVFDSGGASPATADITPTSIGDMLVVIVNNENSPGTGDNQLTAVNCSERLDLVAPQNTAAERTIGGLGTLLADVVAQETLGFSFAGTPDQWSCHAIPLLKA